MTGTQDENLARDNTLYIRYTQHFQNESATERKLLGEVNITQHKLYPLKIQDVVEHAEVHHVLALRMFLSSIKRFCFTKIRRI